MMRERSALSSSSETSRCRDAYPPGVSVRNNGVVIFDSPNRTLPYAHQFTLGYERELRRSLALHVDYVRAINKDMFLARNLNPALRATT